MLPIFNHTFATPARDDDVVLNSSMLSVPGLPGLSHPSIVNQPFEDDSPSKFPTISAFEHFDSQLPNFSPYMEWMTNGLEQSIMSHFDAIEDRVADRIVTKKKRCGSRKR